MKHLLIGLLILLPLFTTAQPGIINTIAGTGVAGSAGDSTLADSARLQPYSVAVDQHGNVFVSDNYFNKVRKFREGDTIYTLVGDGYPGFGGDGGPAQAARLSSPVGLTVDAAGNLYIADAANYVVRKINVNDTITTIAGNHTTGYYSCTGVPATTCKIGASGLAIDSHGNLYIADGNSRIRRVDSAGILWNFAGNGSVGYSATGGPATAAAFDGPVAVCVDGAGNVYVADKSNNVIRKIDGAGIISAFAGTSTAGFSGDNGPATSAKLNGPNDVKADAYGNVYICDQNNCRIRKVDASGIITTIAGSSSAGGFSGDGGPATNAKLAYPSGIWVDDSLNLYIADKNNYRVRKVGHTIPSAVTTLAAAAPWVRVYPNPSHGSFVLETEKAADNSTVEVYNTAGVRVYTKSIISARTEIVLQQPTGNYFVKIKMGQHLLTQTISIEK